MNYAKKYTAIEQSYTIVRKAQSCCVPPYPYFRSDKGNRFMFGISPNHGRSFVVGREGDRYVVSKGNGLAFSKKSFIHTGEMGNDTWGLLLLKDAIRDFTLGEEIAAYGIKTNRMEYVLELEASAVLMPETTIKPAILQYSVECPYRLCDAAFMPNEIIKTEVAKWSHINHIEEAKAHLIAADVLIGNLCKLQKKGILYNAFHIQNYTWALELLDFELACSPSHPYDEEDSMRHVQDLFTREIIQTYEIINYIAWVLHEEVDYKEIDGVFQKYGYSF